MTGPQPLRRDRPSEASQMWAYTSNKTPEGQLRNHCRVQHQGKIDPACRACREIQARVKSE